MLKRICFNVVLLFVFAVQLNAQKSVLDTLVVARVNAEPITYNEYKYFLDRNRAGVIKYFRNNCGLAYGANFWVATCNSQNPKRYLSEKSLKEAVVTKAQQVVAKKYGVASNITYQQFLVSLEKENKRRLKAVKQNQVIFGPVQYTEKGYYDYLFSNLVIKLKKELAKTEFDLNNQILHAQYEELKDSLFQLGYCTKNSISKLKAKNNGDLTEKEEKLLNDVRLKMDKGRAAKKIISSKSLKKHFEVSYQDYVVNDSVYKGEEEDFLLSLVRLETKNLNVGETSQIIKSNGAYYCIRLQEKQNLGYREFEKCKRVVYDIYLAKLYENYIKEWVEAAGVVIYDENIK